MAFYGIIKQQGWNDANPNDENGPRKEEANDGEDGKIRPVL